MFAYRATEEKGRSWSCDLARRLPRGRAAPDGGLGRRAGLGAEHRRGCGADCGDNGGRGAFIGLVAGTPFGGVGLALVVLGARRRGALLRFATRAAVAGAVLLAILAVVVGVHAVDQLFDSFTGESYERSQMAMEGVASAVVSVILLALAATGLLPWLAARRKP